MGPGARWGSISNPAPSQRDGAGLVGRCHLFSDLQGSGDSPQSPEQGEWMSLLQTFPITNRPPRHQKDLLFTGFLSFCDCVG
jgi:hypothetical protein